VIAGWTYTDPLCNIYTKFIYIHFLICLKVYYKLNKDNLQIFFILI